MKVAAITRTIAHLGLALCITGLAQADQTTQSVQQALKERGFYYGNATGDKSAETAAAIRRYQIRSGLQVTGDINPETLQSLNLSSNSKAAPSSSQATSKPAVAQSNNVRPAETSRLDQNSSPQSPSAPDRQLDTRSTFPGTPYQSMPRHLSGRMVVAEVQRQLMNHGYYGRSVDGRYRRRTAFAVRAFQFGSGLPPTGRLDTSTLDALGSSDANLAYLQPTPRSYETWMPVTKFKHGKWKVKWKKLHREDADEYGLEHRERDRDSWSYNEDRDD